MTLRLKLRLTGNGEADEAYGVSLPTYRLLAHNAATREAIVEIPSFAHPFTEKELAQIPTETDREFGELHILANNHIDILHSHFEKKYREHSGKFKVDPA